MGIRRQNTLLCVRRNRRGGFTLTEVMIAATVILIISLGTLCYQYHGVIHGRTAQAQITATKIGQLILEDWKSTGGDPSYDPIDLDLDFTSPIPVGTGDCMIELDNQTFYIELQHTDIDSDDVAGVRLRQIRVITRYRRDYTQGGLDSDGHEVVLTTYVRRDED